MAVQQHAQLNVQLVADGYLEPNHALEHVADSTSKFQYFWHRQCGQHVAYRSKAAVRARPACLECPRCNPTSPFYTTRRGRAKVVGDDEFRLYALLDTKFPGLHWSMQDRVPTWAGGAVDVCIYFPLQRWMSVQVDGMTHARACMSDRNAETQAAIDSKFVATAIREGYAVLRLDTDLSNSAWEAALQEAIDACMAPGAPAEQYFAQ